MPKIQRKMVTAIVNSMLGKDPYFKIGLGTSGVIHLVLFIGMLINFSMGRDSIKDQVIYSVTLEGGSKIGGMSQAPKKEKSQMAPPKKIQEPKSAKKEIKKEVAKKVEPKEEKKVAVPKKVESKKPDPVKAKEQKKVEAPKKKELSQADIDKRLQEAVQRYTGESTAAGGVGFGAAKLGGEGFGGGVIRPPEFFEYKKILEDYIKTGWNWYDPKAQLQAQVEFDLTPEGEVRNVTLSASSGVTEFDDSVTRAVKKANPVPAPPETVYDYFKKVRITFVPDEGL